MRKGDRFGRIVMLVWLVVAVLILTGLIRAVTAGGLFASVTPGVDGRCAVIRAPMGSGDLALDAADHWLFVAAADRRATPDRPGKGDGLYALNLADPKARLQRLSGTPADFHPHALSFYREMGAVMLGVIDAKSNGRFAIELFDVDATGALPRLRAVTEIQSGLLTAPSALALLPGGRFYVANATTSSSAIGRAAEKYALWPRANLLFYNGMVLKKAINGLSQPEGVAVSADGTGLYLSSANERRVLGFTINPVTGDLVEGKALSLSARPGRLSLDAGGNLIAAAHLKPAILTGLDKNPASPSPSLVYRFARAGSALQDVTQIYGGSDIAGATAAAVDGKRLLAGSALDDKLLDCALK